MGKDTKTVPEVEKEIAAFVADIPTAITTPQQYSEAEKNFVIVRKREKEIAQWFDERIIRPQKKALQEYQSEAKDKLAPIVATRMALGEAMTTWRKAENARLAKEQEKLNKAYDKKIARAEKSGRDITQVAPPPVVMPLAKSNDTAEGKAVYVTRTEVVIWDENLIPLDVPEYWIVTRKPVKKAIQAALEAGKEVPGCGLTTQEVLQVRA